MMHATEALTPDELSVSASDDDDPNTHEQSMQNTANLCHISP
jgi:hypothetical protein